MPWEHFPHYSLFLQGIMGDRWTQICTKRLKSCYQKSSGIINICGTILYRRSSYVSHDGVIKWKHFPRYWPFVRGIHRSQVNSPHKGQWRGALMFSLICALNKRLSKQSWGWWFETPSCSLWRHCNERSMCEERFLIFRMLPMGLRTMALTITGAILITGNWTVGSIACSG